VGHWWESDDFVQQVAGRVGGNPDRAAIKASAKQAASQVEMLAGRAFGTSETRTESIDSGGFPFVHVEDLQIGTHEADAPAWPIRDLANPALATVLQVQELGSLARTALPDGDALRVAGSFVAYAYRAGRLSREFMLQQLRRLFRSDVSDEQRLAYFRGLADPAVRIQIPIAAGRAQGWWMQITRRLIVVTEKTRNDQRLLEPLLEKSLPLFGVEPMLILAPMTTHPVERAFAARIWPTSTALGVYAPWRIFAGAVHQYGIPILTVDDASTPEETSCQLVLLAHWHGYLTNNEPALVDVIAAAYPRPIERIRLATTCPDDRAAAALLLEGLLRPGFDPTLGAHSVRKYVSRKASIAVLEHRKRSRGGTHPWEHFGVSERFYYKLLRRFARQQSGRWQVDDQTRRNIENYLRRSGNWREVRAAAMAVLQQRGFSYAAARKWLQRHALATVVTARPRSSRSQENRPTDGASQPEFDQGDADSAASEIAGAE
jgi:hypothetical protein